MSEPNEDQILQETAEAVGDALMMLRDSGQYTLRQLAAAEKAYADYCERFGVKNERYEPL